MLGCELLSDDMDGSSPVGALAFCLDLVNSNPSALQAGGFFHPSSGIMVCKQIDTVYGRPSYLYNTDRHEQIEDTTVVQSLKGVMRPPKTDEEKKAAKKALDNLINNHFDGNKNKMARELGFTRNAISFWFSKGYVGAQAAMTIERGLTPINLEMKDIRPDIATRREEARGGRPPAEPPVMGG
jgi:hypothetical protein